MNKGQEKDRSYDALALCAPTTTLRLRTAPSTTALHRCVCDAGSFLSSGATSFLNGEVELVLFTEALHTIVIDLQTVPCIERRGRLTSHCLRILAHFSEQVLEPSRGDDLKDPARPVAGVPKGMPLVAGFEDEIPLLRVHDLIAELCAPMRPSRT